MNRPSAAGLPTTAPNLPPESAPSDAVSEERDPGPRCLDCGTALRGPFCHECGQRVESRLVPLRRLLGGALDDVVGLDTRIARSVRLLFRHPGVLTLEYWAGRRARQTPPFRLYLLASLLYFVVLELSGSTRFFFLNVTSTGGEASPMAVLIERLPRMMFLLIPAFAGILALLYRRARLLYTEHFVFAIHYHAAAFAILSLDAAVQPTAQAALANGDAFVLVITAVVAGAAQLGALAYLFLALRRVYGGGRIVTFAKTVALFVSYLMILFAVTVLSLPEFRRVIWNALQS